MACLKDYVFRDVTDRPVVLARHLDVAVLREPLMEAAADEHAPFTPGDVEDLLGAWDNDAPYVLAWPYVAPDGTFMLQWLRPVRPDGDGFAMGHGLTTPFGAVCASFPAQDEDMDTEVLRLDDWESLNEADRDQVQQVRQTCQPPQGVRRARQDERLDDYRFAGNPDSVEAWVFTEPGTEPEMALVHIDHVLDDGSGPDPEQWLGTVTGVLAEGGTSTLAGLEVGILEHPELPALLAIPARRLAEHDYDPVKDRHNGGNLSLAIGSAYYGQAMEAEGEERLEGFRQAARFYALSAELGNAQGLCNLGYVYAYGRLGDRDDDRAASCFGRAANLGHGESAYKYADLLSQGRGVSQDLEQAFFYYAMAYERTRQDESPSSRGSASLRLADVLEHGRGCERDRARAFELYVEAEQDLEAALEYEPWYARQLQRAREGTERLARG